MAVWVRWLIGLAVVAAGAAIGLFFTLSTRVAVLEERQRFYNEACRQHLFAPQSAPESVAEDLTIEGMEFLDDWNG